MAKKIYLSPSNQNRNTYATGGTNEMAQCDKIAAATATALRRCGFDVKVGKSGDTMQNRCSESDSFGADIHMPIHTNAYNGSYTGGTRIFCLNSNGKGACDKVLKYLGAISPGTADSVRYETGLYEINVPSALTVYVECEFHDTTTGANWIINNVTKIGEAICHGLCDYFGVTYKTGGSSSNNSNQEEEEMIERGKTNNSILTFKKQLLIAYSLGIIKTRVDSSAGYGDGTDKAVRELQKVAKIEIDGIVGKDTINALYNLITKAITEKNNKIANAKKALA